MNEAGAQALAHGPSRTGYLGGRTEQVGALTPTLPGSPLVQKWMQLLP